MAGIGQADPIAIAETDAGTSSIGGSMSPAPLLSFVLIMHEDNTPKYNKAVLSVLQTLIETSQDDWIWSSENPYLSLNIAIYGSPM